MFEALISQEFDHKKNVNYQLIEGQEKMSALMLKTQKASVLPSLSRFLQLWSKRNGR